MIALGLPNFLLNCCIITQVPSMGGYCRLPKYQQERCHPWDWSECATIIKYQISTCPSVGQCRPDCLRGENVTLPDLDNMTRKERAKYADYFKEETLAVNKIEKPRLEEEEDEADRSETLEDPQAGDFSHELVLPDFSLPSVREQDKRESKLKSPYKINLWNFPRYIEDCCKIRETPATANLCITKRYGRQCTPWAWRKCSRGYSKIKTEKCLKVERCRISCLQLYQVSLPPFVKLSWAQRRKLSSYFEGQLPRPQRKLRSDSNTTKTATVSPRACPSCPTSKPCPRLPPPPGKPETTTCPPPVQCPPPVECRPPVECPPPIVCPTPPPPPPENTVCMTTDQLEELLVTTQEKAKSREEEFEYYEGTASGSGSGEVEGDGFEEVQEGSGSPARNETNEEQEEDEAELDDVGSTALGENESGQPLPEPLERTRNENWVVLGHWVLYSMALLIAAFILVIITVALVQTCIV